MLLSDSKEAKFSDFAKLSCLPCSDLSSDFIPFKILEQGIFGE